MNDLVGGAIGNGLDRLRFGQVTDFIVRSDGVFNLADHAIEMGVFLLIINEVVRWLKDKMTKGRIVKEEE
ncbi:signal peptidase II [Ammoniphilus sp. CFH 90114]|uniref:signal peptidase II n=1 Tax=Ammoniphilus sp. CFH 90114 TaxID=2493665 RepID=UPI00196AF47C|nr:signal peptidase II [Ammoniphilus sp. CFH 90114]